jgi:probable HAF family extracellular repeat protein
VPLWQEKGEGEMNRKIRLITLAFILAVAAPAQQAIGYYQIIDLGTLGGNESTARSINNNGQIVGWADDSSGNSIATLFDPTGGGNNIALSGLRSEAWSINNNGQIVGCLWDFFPWSPVPWAPSPIATLFDPTGGGNNIILGTLGGVQSRAYSINNNGQIVGQSFDVGPYNIPRNERAILFDSTGGEHNIDLGTLGREYNSGALSINNNGQIVGWDVGRATLFDPTGGRHNIALSNLGSRASSINNQGQIVGWVWGDTPVYQRAILFYPTGSGNNIDLGTLGGTRSCALSINEQGQIVGWAYDTESIKAALFDPTGGGNNIDLNTLIDPALGWTLQYATSINDNGWIAGVGINPAGYGRAYLLIPEPASAVLLGFGAFFLRKRHD